MNDEMNDSMSSMLLVGLSQSEWESIMQFIAYNNDDDDPEGRKIDNIIVQKLINQIY